ncbi:hypothetical protein CXG81DRAFT_19314 [Caulochytrium protostelioides]|uniref:Dolichol-phosphate mannosyltransferase subunit 1 n=1 Tax=Caulochytrium protostelioides TaxID=1555241 RepID=A0A4V1IUJ4_9FUNG|nr:hypothetical protein CAUPRSCDRAFT_8924 [Caulochytrium protostelioides]RKP00769.1 hypothetical protein CXG81DRAFT_19314 [Caulochytrium protostelioides]|eukprot:RKP00769.1 hypothetical protein CXG81DRAFT_19314 [Caulochytrium protostelioides]
MESRRAAPGSDAAAAAAKNHITTSVIVPAFRENANLRPLATRLFKAFADPASPIAPSTVELVVVDDNSRDGSVETVAALQREGLQVRIVVRTTERGLSSAVMRGFHEAKGEVLVCMDADLQHPPEFVPALAAKVRSAQNPAGKPFVLGTRYAPGVSMDKDWPLHRRVISSGARMLARPLTVASDPMSGFFGLSRDLLDRAKNVDQHGFKIALDLLVKTGVPAAGIGEHAFSFGLRTEGESKLSSKVILRYLQQLFELYVYQYGLGFYLALLLLMLAALFVLHMLLQAL